MTTTEVPFTPVDGEPDRIGRFVFRRRLAWTRLSKVYLAADEQDGQLVALKRFDPDPDSAGSRLLARRDVYRERFLAESHLIASFDHPHIIPIIERGGEDGPAPWYIMPFMPANLPYEIGVDAREADAGSAAPARPPRALTLGRAVRILAQVLDALAALHRRGIVHRDLKPHNVLLSALKDGDVRLCDFGMAKTPEHDFARPGTWVGTVGYRSPEQARDATKVDARTDVYAVGILAYRMLCGVLPPESGPETPLADIAPEVPQKLERLVTASLSTDPNGRPDDAGQMLKKLRRALR